RSYLRRSDDLVAESPLIARLIGIKATRLHSLPPVDKSAESEHDAFRVKGFPWNGYDSLDLREIMCRCAWTTGVGIMRRCDEIVMVVRSKPINFKPNGSNGSNRLTCKS